MDSKRNGRIAVLAKVGKTYKRYLIYGGPCQQPFKIFGREHEDASDRTVHTSKIVFKSKEAQQQAGFGRFNGEHGVVVQPDLFRHVKTNLNGMTTFSISTS